jgi:uncharacterized protein YeaO (DUF488 family)
MIQLKRAYEKPSRRDGTRVLVERLWPRGLTRARAAVDVWLKEIAPSPALRTWFGHDPAKWTRFRSRYWKELRAQPIAVEQLRRRVRRGPVTLVYAARDEERNGAVALRQFLSRRGTVDPKKRPARGGKAPPGRFIGRNAPRARVGTGAHR